MNMNMTMAVALMTCTWMVCSVMLLGNYSISVYTMGIMVGWGMVIGIACWWLRYTQKHPLLGSKPYEEKR